MNVLRDSELVVDGQLVSVQNTQITTIVARVLLLMSTLKQRMVSYFVRCFSLCAKKGRLAPLPTKFPRQNTPHQLPAERVTLFFFSSSDRGQWASRVGSLSFVILLVLFITTQKASSDIVTDAGLSPSLSFIHFLFHNREADRNGLERGRKRKDGIEGKE